MKRRIDVSKKYGPCCYDNKIYKGSFDWLSPSQINYEPLFAIGLKFVNKFDKYYISLLSSITKKY